MTQRYVSGSGVSPGAPRVLIVEDDESELELISRRLVDVGCFCIEASDGETALRVAGECRIDLIVLDVHLPGIDGIEVVRVLRERGLKPRLIVYTNDPLDEASRADLLLGPTRFLQKEDSLVLVAAVARMLDLPVPAHLVARQRSR